jgi:hypothetical protein
VEDMRFTEEEVIRMNITLGITGDMFREHGVFYTDFLANQGGNDAKLKKKITRRRVSLGELSNVEEDDEVLQANGETVDPTTLIANSMKPEYIKRAIQKDSKVKGYNPDIDNFPGVNNIENFIIAALTDESDLGGIVTKGIL